jgi:hypothetical protein
MSYFDCIAEQLAFEAAESDSLVNQPGDEPKQERDWNGE